jgi:hypothetical protein
MKRLIIGQLACVLALGLSLPTAPTAHAAPKKGKAKAAAQAPKEAPESAEISKSMADLKWGTSRDEVMQHFINAVKEKYKPLIAKTTGAIEEDKLRAKMRDELGKIRSSLVEFNGTKTGWDVSFLKGEFTHNNSESMFVVTDENSQNYYFFIQGKLWKWYKAFNASVFQGKSFDEFAQSIEGRFGQAQRREGELVEGSGKQRWLEWRDANTRLRAVDNNQFYGFYCLVFEHKETVSRLADLRTVKPSAGKGVNAMVDAVTSDEPDEADDNKNVIDRITGKIRQREDAPAPATAKEGKSAKAASAAPASSSPSVAREDDPLSGL